MQTNRAEQGKRKGNERNKEHGLEDGISSKKRERETENLLESAANGTCETMLAWLSAALVCTIQI